MAGCLYNISKPDIFKISTFFEYVTFDDFFSKND